MGYAPWPEGSGLVLRRLAEELPGRPLLVAECGFGTDDDDWRVEVLRESLEEVERAIDDGVDVRGLFHWTARRQLRVDLRLRRARSACSTATAAQGIRRARQALGHRKRSQPAPDPERADAQRGAPRSHGERSELRSKEPPGGSDPPPPCVRRTSKYAPS